ncbi:MAG: hypothetical protein F6J97_26735 [Leptolyngbya sp. SIO4C1]|nr:hypothetical protein [Leptolyngbya sp. SIO4C1]
MVGLPLSLWLIEAWRLAYGAPLAMIVLLCLPLVTTLLTVALLYGLGSAWRQPSWAMRSHYLLVTLAAAAFISFLNYWNLLGFKF